MQEAVVGQGITPWQVWMGMVGSVTAAGVVIGLASRPFKTMRKTVDDAVGDLKGQTSDLRTELKGEVADLGTALKGELASIGTSLANIEGHVRDHAEALRSVQRGQEVLLASLEGVLTEGARGAADAAIRHDERITPITSALAR